MDGKPSGAQQQEMDLHMAASDFSSRGFDLRGLQQVLKDADSTWIEKFLQSGGLSNLLSTLDRKGDGLNNVQECVVCIKLVLNHKLGVKALFEQPYEDQSIRKLVDALDTDCVALKQDVFELLSALCLLSDKGYNLCLDALESYKQSKHGQCRFSVLMKEMRESSNEEYLASIMAFVNCVLKGASDLKKRIRLRNEFLALELLDLLLPWRHTANEALAIQIQVFKESHAEDSGHLDKPGGVNVNSHEDLFHAVLNKVCCAGHNKSFLNILRNLLSLDKDDPMLDTFWEDMEQLCSQAMFSNAPTEIAAIAPPHSQVEKKLRVESDSGDSIPDSQPSAPGPPPIPGGPPPPPPPPLSGSSVLQPLMNWNKVSRAVATNEGVIWQKAAKGEMDTIVDIDPARVEELFPKPHVKNVEEKTKPTSKEGDSTKVLELDIGTERDTVIILKRLKMKNSDVVNNIKKFDPSNMTVTQLKDLEKKINAMKEKLEKYKGAQGDFTDDSSQLKLSRAQDFYLQLTRVDRPDLRIKLMRAQMEFSEMLADLKSPSSKLEDAIDEILGCKTLTQLFLVILNAGNILNAGTRGGEAYGFKIESLRELKRTKSRYPEVHFLHFIAQVCEDQSPDLLQVFSKLPSLKEASRINYEDLSKDFKKVKDMVDEFDVSFGAENVGEDVKEKFVIVSGDIQMSLKKCEDILGRTSKKKEQLAVYFCEDPRTLELDKLLTCLLTFITEFNKAIEANSDKKQKKLLNSRRNAVGTPRTESDFGEVELETGIIDNVLMEMKAGSFQCRWSL